MRGRVLLCIRLPYPYVPHLLSPSLVVLLPVIGWPSAFSPNGLGTLPQVLEEPIYLFPDFPATAQAPPVHSDEPHEAVALVDRDQEVLPRPSYPVHEKGLHVPLHASQHRVVPLQLLPGAEFQERFRRTHRAWIERRDPLGGCAVEEERHVHRYPQALPLRVAHLEVFEEQAAVGYDPVAAFARRFPIEEDGARPAGAHDLPRGDVQEMPVFGRYRLAAQLAALLNGLLLSRHLRRLLGLLLSEPAQRGESGESLPV